MPPTGRMFLCARCRVQVVVCSHCDRGQIYCGSGCSADARRVAQRAAGARYQSSRAGRFAHAARSRRYRARCKIVTHQGSFALRADALLLDEAAVVVAPEIVSPVESSSAPRCACCGACCARALRWGFIRHHRRPALDRPIGVHRPEGVDEHPP